MTSRQILIIIIAVVLVILAVGLYFLFFGKSAMPTGAQTGTGQTTSLPNAGDQQNTSSTGVATNGNALATSFVAVSNTAVLDYFASASGSVTAIEPNGEIIQIANGSVTTLSSLTMQNMVSAGFSYDGSKLFINFGDPQNPQTLQTSVFDIATQKWMPLVAGMVSPVWSPSDDRIAYRTSNTNGTETLATINTSLAKPAPTSIITLHAQDLVVSWANKTTLALSTKPSAYDSGSAWLINAQSGVMTPAAIETPGLDILWSGAALGTSTPMGLEFTSGNNDLGGSIALTDAVGNITQELTFATLSSKCAFTIGSSAAASGTITTPYLYCAVPRDQNAFGYAHLPDDYDQMALFTSDDLYRINLQTGAIDAVYKNSSEDSDVSDIKIYGNAVYFINRYNSKLYEIEL